MLSLLNINITTVYLNSIQIKTLIKRFWFEFVIQKFWTKREVQFTIAVSYDIENDMDSKFYSLIPVSIFL